MAKQRPVRLGAACLLLQLQQLLQQQSTGCIDTPPALLQLHVQQCLAFLQQGRDPQQRRLALLLLDGFQDVNPKP